MEKTPEDSAMRQTHRAVMICGAALSAGAFAFFGFTEGLSVLAGAAVASLNLYVLSRTVTNLVEGQRSSWAGIAVVKFVVLLAVTYGLIQSGLVEPFALAIGFGALPIGIVAAGTLGASKPLPELQSSSSVKTDHA